jgi:hypothetical protein
MCALMKEKRLTSTLVGGQSAASAVHGSGCADFRGQGSPRVIACSPTASGREGMSVLMN